jgi:hypothetical protein
MKIVYLLLTFTLSLFSWQMEADTMVVKNTTNGVITHIDFRQHYDTTPLVFTLTTDTGSDPAVLRVINVTQTGFDLYSVEPDGKDGTHAEMSAVPYIAIEEGSHELPDGTKILASKISTSKFQSKLIDGDSWESISLSGFNTTPVVLGQIQTRNSERTDEIVPDAPSQPWMTTAIKSVSSSGFTIALERSETTTGIVQNEDIAYLVMESGLNGSNYYFASSEAKKIEYETIRSDDIIQGWDNSSSGYVVNFSKSYSKPIAIATKNRRDGPDGGWLRRRDIADDSMALVVDEDQSTDSERSHTTEVVGILLFSEPFDADFVYSGQAGMMINELMYNETATGKDNNEFIEFYVTQSGDLKGFVLTDQDTNEYIFPAHTVTEGEYVILHIGTGTDGSSNGVHHFYRNSSTILNNSDDDVLLLKPSQDVTSSADGSWFNAEPLDYVAYGRSSVGNYIDAIPTSMRGKTLNWSYDKGSELKGADDGQSISLSPNKLDSDMAGCWELTASGNASDNGCSGYIITRDANGDATLTYSLGETNTALPDIKLSKNSVVLYDPVNEEVNPKAIPGSIVKYTIRLRNEGLGSTDTDTIHINDTIPVNMRLCVSAVGECQESTLSQGTIDSNLSLGSISYYSNGAVHTAVPDAQGYDDDVTEIKFNLNGSFAASDGTNHPSATIEFYMGLK